MVAKPYLVLLESSCMFLGKNPSSGLRFKHENVDFTSATHATKIMWIAL